MYTQIPWFGNVLVYEFVYSLYDSADQIWKHQGNKTVFSVNHHYRYLENENTKPNIVFINHLKTLNTKNGSLIKFGYETSV